MILDLSILLHISCKACACLAWNRVCIFLNICPFARFFSAVHFNGREKVLRFNDVLSSSGSKICKIGNGYLLSALTMVLCQYF